MKKQTLLTRPKAVWREIAALPVREQPTHFWRWASEVVGAQERGDLTIQEAAKLLIWPDSARFQGLSSNANVLVVLDTAESIEEGCAYAGVPEKEGRDWAELASRVRRRVTMK